MTCTVTVAMTHRKEHFQIANQRVKVFVDSCFFFLISFKLQVSQRKYFQSTQISFCHLSSDRKTKFKVLTSFNLIAACHHVHIAILILYLCSNCNKHHSNTNERDSLILFSNINKKPAQQYKYVLNSSISGLVSNVSVLIIKHFSRRLCYSRLIRSFCEFEKKKNNYTS